MWPRDSFWLPNYSGSERAVGRTVGRTDDKRTDGRTVARTDGIVNVVNMKMMYCSWYELEDWFGWSPLSESSDVKDAVALMAPHVAVVFAPLDSQEFEEDTGVGENEIDDAGAEEDGEEEHPKENDPECSQLSAQVASNAFLFRPSVDLLSRVTAPPTAPCTCSWL